MKKETWEKCNKQEKILLLKHWFYYYGGIIMDLEDMDKFNELVMEYKDEIFDHIVTSCVFRNTIQSNLLVECMRNGRVDELFSHSIKKEDISEEYKEQYNCIRNRLFKEIRNSFNNPKEDEVAVCIAVSKNKTR